MNDSIKYTLDERDIPRSWYNIVADLPGPPPPVRPSAPECTTGPDPKKALGKIFKKGK